MDTAQKIKFDLSFIQQIDIYIQEDKNPTLAGFAKKIGTDVDSLWAWANKKKKDPNGNLTEELARPTFNQKINVLHNLSKKNPVVENKKEDIPSETKVEPVKTLNVEKVKLTLKQELFCQLYATDREFFGNGVQTYIEVYEPDQTKKGWYQGACASASRLLSDVKVFTRINELLEVGGLNDQNVDKQLMFLINQQADFGAKAAAIREYNKLKKRITEKIDHTTNGKDMPTPIYGGKSTEL